MNLCILASGKGSNFRYLLKAKKSGKFKSRFVLVVSNNSDSGVLKLARKNNIPAIHLSSKQFKSRKEYVKSFISLLKHFHIDLILMSGYMKLLPKEITRLFKNKIINVHPSLMPAFCGEGFFGMKVHEAVINSGVEISGATVHIVDEKYDHGPVVLQKIVKVEEKDTPSLLRSKVLRAENKILSDAIRVFESKKIKVVRGKVKFI